MHVCLEQFVRAGPEVVVQGGEEGVVVLGGQVGLVGVSEAQDYFFHLLLRKLGALFILNLLPRLLLALWVWHGSQAVNACLHRLIRLIFTQYLLEKAHLWILLNGRHATEPLEQVSLL